MSDADTIAAPATAAGRAGIGIVRISGAKVVFIAENLLGKLPTPRYASFHVFRDARNNPIDEGLALYFPAPRSFTGEDVLELHGHGGRIVMDLLLQRVCELGARVARPGEFSERAFLNNKLDLTQAEAIADLIDAGSREAASAALRSLHGAFSAQINILRDGLIALRMYVEAAIDFPEEEIDWLNNQQIKNQLENLLIQLKNIEREARQGVLLHEGMRVVIAGLPNAGKSSLLNQLSGRDSAIVTAIPGTTRDVLREQIQIDGLPLEIIDTAGLRDSDDPVEQEGIRRAEAEILQADRVLCLRDSAANKHNISHIKLNNIIQKHPRVTEIYNKIDLINKAPEFVSPDKNQTNPAIYLSAKTGAGIDLLKTHLKNCMGFQDVSAANFTARRRHLDALARARSHAITAREYLHGTRAGELLAEELRLAQQALGEITGEFSADDLLGKIFQSFCIGK